MSFLFRTKATVHAHTPEQFLQFAKKCMEQVQVKILPSGISAPLKFNNKQCKYLAHKLKLALEGAQTFLLLLNQEAFSPKDMANFLEVFKLLFAFANVVEDFIQNCCQDAWVQAIELLTNVSEHVSSIGFNLELWTLFFSGRLILTTVDAIYKAEVKIVEEMALEDREMLMKDVKTLLRTEKSTNTEYKLAALLLERLLQPKPYQVNGLLRSFQVNEENLKQMRSLGKGAFATVYRALWLGVEVAKKTFYARNSPDFEKEVFILQGLSHFNITSLLGYTKDDRECSIIMELMDEDLFSLMQRRMKEYKTRGYPFGILEAIDIMFQVGRGMQYLHEMRIVHRDLKSMNILIRYVKARDFEIEYILAKVSDFGLSKTKERSLTYTNQTPNMGTARWMAPEMIKISTSEWSSEISNHDAVVAKYPFSSDVYSFAMVCYEILTGEMPYFEVRYPNQVKEKVLKGERPEIPSHCPLNLKSLIERCWSANASTRPSFAEVCTELRHLKCLLLISPLDIYSNVEEVSKAISKPLTQVRYTLAQVMVATYNKAIMMGKNRTNFSPLYYGKLANGQNVAVRVAARIDSREAYQIFINKVEHLTRVHHKNLVSLVGYCDEGDNEILLYEYMPLGTVQAHLYGVVGEQKKKPFLDWKTRLQIALNSAQALEYLHMGCHPAAFHGDVKSSKILLNDKVIAKVAGFGFSKSKDNVMNMSTMVKDNIGYLDPKHFSSNPELTDKSDVYGFGIVLLELICARPPFTPHLSKDQRRLDEWARTHLLGGTIEKIVDPTLRGEYNLDAMWKVAELAMESVEPKAQH